MKPAELVTLKNGLRVVLVPCEAESIAFGLFVASGSRHESNREAGISHLIEHMLFKGTPERTALQITQSIEGRGGNFNAFTSEEATVYYAHMPNECLAEAVDILSDMYAHASIATDDFNREKQVVLEEIKMYHDDPDAVAYENLQRALFPSSTLGRPVAGGPESLCPLKPADLKRYIRAHYRPDNTIAVVAGAFDREEALAVIARSLGRARSVAKPKAVKGDDPNGLPPVGEVTVTKDVQQLQLALGYRTFGSVDPRKYAATVLDAVLGRGMSSRLFQEVREKRGLSYDISSRMGFFHDAGMLSITAGLDPSKGDIALATIDREIAHLCDKRVGAAELRRTKDFLIGNFRLGHEKMVSKMFFYGSTVQAFGRLVTPEEQVERVASVTADDVRNAALAIFRPELRSVSRVMPR